MTHALNNHYEVLYFLIYLSLGPISFAFRNLNFTCLLLDRMDFNKSHIYLFLLLLLLFI